MPFSDRRAALTYGRGKLMAADVENPSHEACLLLADCLQLRKEEIYTKPEKRLSWIQSLQYRRTVMQRGRGRALAYITGRKEFYSRMFKVTRSVLVPRPDSETLVDAVLSFSTDVQTIHDACTGSGCIAISLAREGRFRVSASDISRRALRICAENNALHGNVLEALYHSNCLESVPGRFDVITANPPYLRSDELSALRRSGDPQLALHGGDDGMHVLRDLLIQGRQRLEPRGRLVMEIDPTQEAGCRAFAQAHGYASCDAIRDLAGRVRVLVFQLA